MSLIKRNETWWMDVVNHGRRIRKSLKTKDKEQASRLYAKLTHELWENEHFDTCPKRTLKQAVASYIRDNKHKRTIAKDEAHLSTLCQLLGETIELSNIDEQAVYKLKQSELSRGLANASVNRLLAVLRHLLKQNIESGIIKSMPVIKLLPENNKVIRYLSKAEAGRLIASCPHWLKPLVITSLMTGLRQSNVLQLRWDNVSSDAHGIYYITLTPDQMKNNRYLSIPLNPIAVGTIMTQPKHPDGYVFHNEAGARVKAISSKLWARVCSDACIENFRWHDLRHTWASWLVQDGTPLHIVQELGGWESITMVQRYAHLSKKHLADNVLSGFTSIGDMLNGTKSAHYQQDVIRKLSSQNENSGENNMLYGSPSMIRTCDQVINSPVTLSHSATHSATHIIPNTGANKMSTKRTLSGRRNLVTS